MIDGLFGSTNYNSAKALLDQAVLRHEAIASNLANIETPGYRRVDVSPAFDAELRGMIARGDVAHMQAARPFIVEDETARVQRPDGNTVAMDRELMAMNQNALEHEFLTDFLSSSIKRLRSAISGKVG